MVVTKLLFLLQIEKFNGQKYIKIIKSISYNLKSPSDTASFNVYSFMATSATYNFVSCSSHQKNKLVLFKKYTLWN